jgi:sugar phosphate isomerase/epimerase
MTNISRRRFLSQTTLAGAGLLFASDLFAVPAKINGVEVGAITYSFRSMPGSIDDIIKYCKACGITAIELMGDPAEAWCGSPAGLPEPMKPFPPGQRPQFTPEMRAQFEERNKKAKAWRETAPIEKFAALQKHLAASGISIYAYKPDALRETSSDAEIDYAMNAAKALGAKSVTVEIPGKPEQSKRLGDFAAKHKVYVGYHAHTQATDTAWDVALAQSPYNSMNLDCGHYIAAGGANTSATLLALIEAKHDRITSMHLKDRKTKENGAANVEWGKGDTPIKDILQLLKKKKYAIPVSVELEYDVPEGSDAVKEVTKCVAYAKAALE